MKSQSNLKLKLTTITPLFIGSGKDLVRGVDFIGTRNSTVEVIDLDETLAYVYENNPDAFAELEKRGFNIRFFRDYNISPKVLYRLKASGSINYLREIRSFIKDAHNRPYIPGSSIKGAIVRSLWYGLIKSSSYTAPFKNYRKFKEDISKIPGDSHTYFTRPLQVKDTEPLKLENLVLLEVKVFKANSRSTMEPLKKRGGREITIMVEALDRGICAEFEVKLDEFLLREDVLELGRIKWCNSLKDFDVFAPVINSHSTKFIDEEINFFKKYKSEVSRSVISFYEKLKQEVEAMDFKGFIVRLGWGVGWKTTTGNWLDEEELKAVLREEQGDFRRVSFVSFDLFPKTRKLAKVRGAGFLPLGWVKVEVVDKRAGSFAVQHPRAEDTEKRSKEDEKKSVIKEEKKKIDFESERSQRIAEFDKNTHPDSIPGMIETYISQVRSEKDEDLKKKMVEILIKKANSLKKNKKFTKALNNKKTWALKLKELADEVGVNVD